MTKAGFETPKEEDTLLFAAKRLAAADRTWFIEYAKRYERDYEVQYRALLAAPDADVRRQQGICSAMDNHLRILKLAL